MKKKFLRISGDIFQYTFLPHHGRVGVISSNPPCKDGNEGFTRGQFPSNLCMFVEY